MTYCCARSIRERWYKVRTSERLRKLKQWTYDELCKGRKLKTPASKFDIAQIAYKEPVVYLAWAPMQLDKSGRLQQAETYSTCPSITIMPTQSYAKYMEEKPGDRYANIHRPQDMGQHLGVQLLFMVYEPGVRLPGFIDSTDEHGAGLNMGLMEEGTEQGLITLMNWMDDCMEKLLGVRAIPDTDLFVEDAAMTYSLYTDQSYVVDKRPLYYGFVTVSFGCYATDKPNPDILEMLN